MPNPVWNMEAANLFCGKGAGDNASSNHLILVNVKLPSINASYIDYRPGGAPMAIEVDIILDKLECSFSLLGLTPQVMGLIRSFEADHQAFYIYGVLRDQITGALWQAAAHMRGQLARFDPTPWTHGDVLHSSYAIRGISHYEFKIADREIYYYDFAENVFRSNSPSFQGQGLPASGPT